MLKHFISLLFILFCCTTVSATHIAGGEFALTHISENNYRLNFYLYFDDVNGSPGAMDNNVEAVIFEKGSNKLISKINLPFRSRTPLGYTNIDCSISSLKTSLISYYSDIVLDPAIYTNPEGYYVTWERCCRSNAISNIQDSGSSGMVFYMEFPAVVKNGNPFINSSPQLSHPSSDYACVGEPYQYTFNTIDPDGDELIYDLVPPLRGYTSPVMPIYNSITVMPLPLPYPEVSWLSGYSGSNQIHGNPALSIDPKSGKLTIVPNYKGLFIFAIRCQEFRNGVKIGEVRRDYQLLVLSCPKNEPPTINAFIEGQTNAYNEGELITIGSADTRRIKVTFTDPDIYETLTLTAKPVNFSNSDFNFKGTTQGIVNTPNGKTSLEVFLYFDACFDSKGQTYLLDLIVNDNKCPTSNTDTIRLSIVAEPIPDTPPSVSFTGNKKVYTVEAGDELQIEVIGNDPDNEKITLSARGIGFGLESKPITFNSKTDIGSLSSDFLWKIDCETVKQPSYQVEFRIVSSGCGQEVIRTEIIEIQTKVDKITKNTISSSQTICPGQVPVFLNGSLPEGGNNSYTYTWEMSTSGENFVPASGVNNTQNYSPTALDKTTWFRRTVNRGLCSESISDAVKITVIEPIQNNILSSNQSICINGLPALLEGTIPSGGTGSYTYRWEISLEGPSSGFMQAPGTFNSPQYQPEALTQNTWFRRVVTSGICSSSVSVSDAIQITVVPPIQNNSISGTQLVCFGTSTSLISGNTISGGTGTYTYRWEYSTTGESSSFVPAPGRNTDETYTSAPLTQSTWFRRIALSSTCERISNTFNITVDPTPTAATVKGATICPNQSATLTADIAVSDYTLQWYDAPIGGTLLYTGKTYTTPVLLNTTSYYVQAVNTNGCPNPERTKVTVVVFVPVADAGEDKTIVQGASLELNGKGGETYLWSPATGLSDPNIANPIAKPQETTTYTLTVITANGCTATDEVTITVLPLISPTNAITLNGDNVNDTWHIRNIEHYPNCRVQVFTGAGVKVFESKGYKEEWNGMQNGKYLPKGVYYYIIDSGMNTELISGSITFVK